MIITGANSIVSEAAQFEGRDNPVFNFFTEIYLQLLEAPECALMIRELGRGMGLRFTAEAIAYIYSLTGGHPFFARQLSSFAAQHYRDRPLVVERPMVESLRDRYLDERASDFEEIVERLKRDFPDELRICIELAAADGRLPISHLRQRTSSNPGSPIRHLSGYQIVVTTATHAYLTIDLLVRWLKKRYV